MNVQNQHNSDEENSTSDIQSVINVTNHNIQDDHMIPQNDRVPLLTGSDVDSDGDDHVGDNIEPIIKPGLSPESIRLIRTVSMMLFYICMGLCCGVVSPATLDLMQLYHCNLVQFSLMMTSRQAGLVLGCFVGGVISNKLRRKADLMLALMAILLGTANSVVPWCPKLWIAVVPVLLSGLAHGTINVVCSSVTIAEWGEKSPAPINLLHFAFSVGSFLAPVTVAPFLSTDKNTTGPNYWGISTAGSGSPFSWRPIEMFPNESTRFPAKDVVTKPRSYLEYEEYGNSTHSEPSRIYIAFAFHGAVGAFAGLLFLLYYFSGWQYQSAASMEENSSGNTEQTRFMCNKFKIQMGISIFVVYIGIITRDLAMNGFIFYVAVKGPLHISKLRAAVLNTVNNASWVVGRGIGTILAHFVKIHILVFTGITGVLVVTIFLIFFGFKAEVALWCLPCAVGLLGGPCYPSVMAWADRYIQMDGIMVGLIDLGIAAGAFSALYVGSYLIHNYGAVYAFVLSAAGSGFLLFIMIALQIFCFTKGDRFVDKSSTESMSRGDIINEAHIN